MYYLLALPVVTIIIVFTIICCRKRKIQPLVINQNIINVTPIVNENQIVVTPDKYFKSDNRNIAYDKDIKDKALKLFLPESPISFIPDSIVINDDRCVMVEYDEGGDFHSKTNNINYIMKWLQYNRYLIKNEIIIDDKRLKFSLIRFTYPSNYNSVKLAPFEKHIKELINDVSKSTQQHYILAKIVKDKIDFKRINIQELKYQKKLSPIKCFSSESTL